MYLYPLWLFLWQKNSVNNTLISLGIFGFKIWILKFD
jgi:hypothetical protein